MSCHSTVDQKQQTQIRQQIKKILKKQDSRVEIGTCKQLSLMISYPLKTSEKSCRQGNKSSPNTSQKYCRYGCDYSFRKRIVAVVGITTRNRFAKHRAIRLLRCFCYCSCYAVQ